MAVETVDKIFMGLGLGAIVVAVVLIVARGSGNEDADSGESKPTANGTATAAPDAAGPDAAGPDAAKPTPPKPPAKVVPAAKRPPLPKATGSTPAERLDSHFKIMADAPEHDEPFIEVQHILVGFVHANGEGSVPGKSITRNLSQARELAAELYERANRGEDFDSLVREFTNDAYPGKYGMVNTNGDSGAHPGAHQRGGMVPAFGNVGWRLGVGEIGVSEFSKEGSPYGFHVIKRIR